MSKRGLTAYADCAARRVRHPRDGGLRAPGDGAHADPRRHRQAGLELEGVSSEEPLEGVVERIVAACLDPRPRRDAAVTRAGALQLLAARHLPELVDRVVARQVRKRARPARFDEAPIAAGLRERHGR